MSTTTMTTTTVRRDIVRATTAHKLSLLRKQKDLLKSCFDSIEIATSSSSSSSPSPNDDPVRTLIVTAEQLRTLRLTNCERTRLSAGASLEFLKLHDPRPPPIGDLQKWQHKLEAEMKYLQRRTEHAVVFCDVIQEWLDEEMQSTSPSPSEDKFEMLEDTRTNEESDFDFAPIPNPPFDPVSYLRENGIREDLIQEFSRMAGNVIRFGVDLLKPDYIISDLAVIEAMRAIASDARAYPPDARAQLGELVKQPMIVSELASSYTSTWHDIVDWDWPESGIAQIAQKHMSGKVRSFLQLDISIAIFLEVVGQTWSTFFSRELARARDLACWPKAFDLQSLRTGEERKIGNILALLEAEQANPSNHDHDDGDDGQDGNVDIDVAYGSGLGWTIRCNDREEFGSILKPAGAPYTTDETQGEGDTPQQPQHWTSSLDAARTASSYDKVFRSITTDLALTRTVAPDLHFGVLHADLKDFGPSVPHQVSLSILRFFGLPEAWIKWYTTYLRIPIRNPDGRVLRADRGTPFGLKASTLVNELLLILLDVVVAQKTRLPLHRNHDDFWIWSSRLESITGSWDLLQDFAKRTGLKWNDEKSGFTLVRGAGPSAVPPLGITGLPSNKLRWGLLQLVQDGSWTFDEDLLLIQADALKKDLADSAGRSFLSIVNLWNRYQSYIVRNVGTPTPTTGLDHLSLVTRTLYRFQVLVLNSDSGGETIEHYLREMFQARFPNHRSVVLSEPVLIWPATLGGFQLHQHGLHALLQETKLRDLQMGEPLPPPFKRSLEEAKQLYNRIRQAWMSGFGDRAWTGGQRSSKPNVVEWVRKLGVEVKPPMVDEQTFLRWAALHADNWNDEYLYASQNVEMDGNELEELAKRVYEPILTEQFGESYQELVPKELVPHYAVLDLAAATKQMFTVQ